MEPTSMSDADRRADMERQRRERSQRSARNQIPYLLQGFLPESLFGKPDPVTKGAQATSPAMERYRERVGDLFNNGTVYFNQKQVSPAQMVFQIAFDARRDTEAASEEELLEKIAEAAAYAEDATAKVLASIQYGAPLPEDLSLLKQTFFSQLQQGAPGGDSEFNPAAYESELDQRVAEGMGTGFSPLGRATLVDEVARNYVTSEGYEKNLQNRRALNLFGALEEGEFAPPTAGAASMGLGVAGLAFSPLLSDNYKIAGYRLGSGLSPAEQRAKEALYWDDLASKGFRENAYKDPLFGAYFPQNSNTNFDGIVRNSEEDRANSYTDITHRLFDTALNNISDHRQDYGDWDREQNILRRLVREVPVLPDQSRADQTDSQKGLFTRDDAEGIVKGVRGVVDSRRNRLFQRNLPMAMHNMGLKDYAVYPSPAADTAAMYFLHNIDPISVASAADELRAAGSIIKVLRGQGIPKTPMRKLKDVAGSFFNPTDAAGEIAYAAPQYGTDFQSFFAPMQSIQDIEGRADDPNFPEKYK